MGPHFYLKHFRLFYAGNHPHDVLSQAEKRFQRFLRLLKSQISAARFLMGAPFSSKIVSLVLRRESVERCKRLFV